MGAGTCCLKCLLIFFNVLLGIIGLVLLAVGVFVRVGAKEYINKYAGDVIQTVITLPSAYNFEGSASGTTSGPPVLDFTVLLAPVAAVLIAFGAALAFIAFLGAFGACCNSRCLLGAYAAVLGIIIVVEIVLAAVFFTGKANNQIKALTLSTLVDEYVDIDDFGLYSLAWNYVMLQLKCCGLNNYEDFRSAKKWRRSRSVVVGGQAMTVNLTTPVTCCKLEGSFPNVQIKDDACAVAPTNLTSNWMTGCWEGVTTFLGGYRPIVVGIITGIICIEVVFMVVAIVLLCTFGKQKVDVA